MSLVHTDSIWLVDTPQKIVVESAEFPECESCYIGVVFLRLSTLAVWLMDECIIYWLGVRIAVTCNLVWRAVCFKSS